VGGDTIGGSPGVGGNAMGGVIEAWGDEIGDVAVLGERGGVTLS